jgi:DNA-binding response OmpR family regulator
LLIVDLLLSDERRELSGWEIVRLVKAHRELRGLPVLVVSADYPTIRSHITEAAAMDGVLMLTKPFSLDSLSVLVRDALRGDQGPMPDATTLGSGLSLPGDRSAEPGQG